MDDATALACMKLINDLREDEGSAVMIVCDNPDFGGPNCMIEVTSAWTGWNEEQFTGDTVLKALQEAQNARDARFQNPALVPSFKGHPG